MTIKPTQKAPALDVATVGGDRFRLADRQPRAFTMIVFYRGLHCPICRPYLRDLDQKIGAFAGLGVELVAVSTDPLERAAESKEAWDLSRLTIGYGLEIDRAREWGLFISRSIKEDEPAEFAEPGLFLVRPDGTLYAAAVQTMPFARPHFADVLAAVEFINGKNYPPRGEA